MGKYGSFQGMKLSYGINSKPLEKNGFFKIKIRHLTQEYLSLHEFCCISIFKGVQITYLPTKFKEVIYLSLNIEFVRQGMHLKQF